MAPNSGGGGAPPSLPSSVRSRWWFLSAADHRVMAVVVVVVVVVVGMEKLKKRTLALVFHAHVMSRSGMLRKDLTPTSHSRKVLKWWFFQLILF